MHRSILIACVTLVLFNLSGGNAAATGEGVKATGTVVVSEELFRSLNYGTEKAITVEKVDEHVYRGLRPIDDVFIDKTPDCFKLFNVYREKYLKEFQAIANSNCEDFIGCWCFPRCPCITFVVKPTALKCWIKLPIFAAKLPVCELPIPEDFPTDLTIA